MKTPVLTAITPLQSLPDDFTFADPGEICLPALLVCDTPGCGCDRALIGVSTRRGTTTVTVTERHLDADQIDTILSGIAAGWGGLVHIDELRSIWQETVAVAAQHPAGTVLRAQFRHDQWTYTPDASAASAP